MRINNVLLPASLHCLTGRYHQPWLQFIDGLISRIFLKLGLGARLSPLLHPRPGPRRNAFTRPFFRVRTPLVQLLHLYPLFPCLTPLTTDIDDWSPSQAEAVSGIRYRAEGGLIRAWKACQSMCSGSCGGHHKVSGLASQIRKLRDSGYS